MREVDGATIWLADGGEVELVLKPFEAAAPSARVAELEAEVAEMRESGAALEQRHRERIAEFRLAINAAKAEAVAPDDLAVGFEHGRLRAEGAADYVRELAEECNGGAVRETVSVAYNYGEWFARGATESTERGHPDPLTAAKSLRDAERMAKDRCPNCGHEPLGIEGHPSAEHCWQFCPTCNWQAALVTSDAERMAQARSQIGDALRNIREECKPYDRCKRFTVQLEPRPGNWSHRFYHGRTALAALEAAAAAVEVGDGE